MKKLVLILTLMFAIGMNANTISNNLKKQEMVQIMPLKTFEMPEIAGRWHCTTTATTVRYDNPDGSYDEITIIHTHCEQIE
ncbi:MAG TPA: hypothetical protein ENK64_01385 [Flavobacteriales bacterium]|nr:hypothetical protein [Flavobacteriales bacterium]